MEGTARVTLVRDAPACYTLTYQSLLFTSLIIKSYDYNNLTPSREYQYAWSCSYSSHLRARRSDSVFPDTLCWFAQGVHGRLCRGNREYIHLIDGQLLTNPAQHVSYRSECNQFYSVLQQQPCHQLLSQFDNQYRE